MVYDWVFDLRGNLKQRNCLDQVLGLSKLTYLSDAQLYDERDVKARSRGVG
jgi:hypothetical protein